MESFNEGLNSFLLTYPITKVKIEMVRYPTKFFIYSISHETNSTQVSISSISKSLLLAKQKAYLTLYLHILGFIP